MGLSVFSVSFLFWHQSESEAHRFPSRLRIVSFRCLSSFSSARRTFWRTLQSPPVPQGVSFYIPPCMSEQKMHMQSSSPEAWKHPSWTYLPQALDVFYVF